MNRKVLLLEPNYKNKFPPIGLMKLATYFRAKGDEVVFYKGDLKEFAVQQITKECVMHLTQIDDSIDWNRRAHAIADYIRYRRKKDLMAVGCEDSSMELLLTPWLEYYKKYYHTGEYKKHPQWDWVGVTTLFTFYWDITIETIEFAKTMVKDLKNLMVGGVLATIQPEQIFEATGIQPHQGTLHTPGKDIDDDDDMLIDELPLDYSILDEIDYVYPDGGSFYSYATRGCIRHCAFCAVWTLEPRFQPYLPLKKRIEQTRRLYGDQRNLLLMDNNVLASKELPTIIDDIRSCGFTPGSLYIEPNWYEIAIRNLRLRMNDRAYINKAYKLLLDINEYGGLSIADRTEILRLRQEYGLMHRESCTREALIASYRFFAPYFEKKFAKQKGRRRFVDYNQGLDARLFTPQLAHLLAQIPIRPVRVAFDDVKTEPKYTAALKMCVDEGLKDFSNYLLYNFHDKPEELYYRLRVNVDLCEKLGGEKGVSIYSFPMKYHPLRGDHSHDRLYIGEHWNRKYIRAVQAILNATKGKVGRGVSFFEKAFGRDESEYMELLIMPETMLLYRLFFEHLGYTNQWRKAMASLSAEEREVIMPIIFENDFNHIEELDVSDKIKHVLAFYKNYRGDIKDPKNELYQLKRDFDKMQKEAAGK